MWAELGKNTGTKHEDHNNDNRRAEMGLGSPRVMKGRPGSKLEQDKISKMRSELQTGAKPPGPVGGLTFYYMREVRRWTTSPAISL